MGLLDAQIEQLYRGNVEVQSLGDALQATGAADLVKNLSAIVEQIEAANKKLDSVSAGINGNVAKANEQLIKGINDLGARLETAADSVSRVVVDSKVEMPDLAPLMGAIEEARQSVASIKMPSLDLTDALIAIVELRQDIQAIEMPKPIDLSGLERRLAELEKPREYEFTIERVNSMPASPIKKITARQV